MAAPAQDAVIRAIEALTAFIDDPENADTYGDAIMALFERPETTRAALKLYLHKLKIQNK